MKKSFVAVITYEDNDQSPVDLSELATWVTVAMMGESVKNLDVTTFHTSIDAAFAMGPLEATKTVTDAQSNQTLDKSGMQQLCIRLNSGPELLINTYLRAESKFDPATLIGLPLSEVYAMQDILLPIGGTK